MPTCRVCGNETKTTDRCLKCAVKENRSRYDFGNFYRAKKPTPKEGHLYGRSFYEACAYCGGRGCSVCRHKGFRFLREDL